jgi:hypothetical protein
MWKTINMRKIRQLVGCSMAKLNIVIADDLDAKFRKEVFQRKGMKKGNLTEAIEEAIDLWLKTKARS